MSRNHGYFQPLPEDFLDKPKMQLVLAKRGLGAITVFLDLQTRMRGYENDTETSYMIPFESLSFLCYRYHMTEEELKNLVIFFCAIDLMKVYEITAENETARYFYSEETLESLLEWKETKTYMAELSQRGVAKRRQNKERGTENEEK